VTYCSKCGTQNADNMNFCGKCGNSLNVQSMQAGNSGYAQPQFQSPPRKKKKTWLFILVGVIILIILISLFSDDESVNEGSGLGNAFAPPSAEIGNSQTFPQDVNSSRFSDAVNNILAGGGNFDGEDYSGGSGETVDSFSGDYGINYAEAYNEIIYWTDEEWDVFFTFMQTNFGNEAVSCLASMDAEQLIHVTVEICLVLQEGLY